MNNMENNLTISKATPLCFKRDDFIVNDFNVDQFVGQCRKYATLETMVEDLGTYHKILCSSMVELINKDYVDFVNLSSNLVGLDKSIKSLSSPLHNLRTEISSLKHSLDETTDVACKMISERSSVHETKLLAHRILCILEGLEKISMQKMMPDDNKEGPNEVLTLDVLERVALEYNLVKFHMDKVSKLSVLADKKEVVLQVENSLQSHLECFFLMGISNNDAASIRKVLQIFSAINKEKQAESCFCEEIVKPHISKIVTEEMISRKGLKVVLEDIIHFIKNHCGLILDVTRGVKKNYEGVIGYDFLVNSVWPEIINNLEYIAPVYIFDHGNTDVFYHNYCACMSFLNEFEQCLAVQTSVRRLRKHPSYEHFMKKWNLDVYFQIRFQEIARVFEHSLLCPFNERNENHYLLNVTFSLWFSLNRCWSNGVFLMPLIHNFWRITIQLISRYVTWTKNMLSIEENQEAVSQYALLKEPKQKVKKTNNQQDTTCPSIVEWAKLLKDMDILLLDIDQLFNKNIMIKFEGTATDVVKEAFYEARKSLKDISEDIGSHIVKMLINLCSPHLKLITDIPKLYRKTNREVPSKPSPYVSLILKPLVEFQHETNQILHEEKKVNYLIKAVEGTFQICTTIIKDVLTSIKKMEDSLKILKRARDKPMGQITTGVMTDDDKIRRQLLIDVNEICKQVDCLGLTCTDIKSYTELQDLVSSAERNTGDSKSSH